MFFCFPLHVGIREIIKPGLTVDALSYVSVSRNWLRRQQKSCLEVYLGLGVYLIFKKYLGVHCSFHSLFFDQCFRKEHNIIKIGDF